MYKQRLPTNSRNQNIYIYSIKPLKSEAIHETGLSGYVVASFFPLIIFIYIVYIYSIFATHICVVVSGSFDAISSRLSPTEVHFTVT